MKKKPRTATARTAAVVEHDVLATAQRLSTALKRTAAKTKPTPVRPLSAASIRRLRLREQASQAVFAHHLCVTTDVIEQWERGEKRPSGPELKLLTLVKKNGLASIA